MDYTDYDIDCLGPRGVNNTALHWLREAKINTLGQLAGYSRVGLTKLHGIGEQYANDIAQALRAFSLSLRDEPETARITAGRDIVTVRFAESKVGYGTPKSYAYYCDIDGIAVGDAVVVDTPSSGLTVVRVVSIAPLTAEDVHKASKWIVDKVDVAAHNARREREARRKVLEAQLEKALEEALRKDRFTRLAELNPDLAPLVEELKGL